MNLRARRRASHSQAAATPLPKRGNGVVSFLTRTITMLLVACSASDAGDKIAANPVRRVLVIYS
ncbi:MAG TPA: hypothetical protein VM574_00360, partial [Terrimicrobiaceae bacterium]|nr:hypothetical protein [Terrimicrobiaceae bacterium]